MDRHKARWAVSGSPVQVALHSSLQLLLQAGSSTPIRTAAHASCRRDLYGLAILWFAEDSPGAEEGGVRCQPKARATHHAAPRFGEQSTRTKHLKATPRAHQTPLFVKRPALARAPGGLEHRYYLHSAPKRVCVPGSYH